MDPTVAALIGAGVGATIGALGAIISVWIAQRQRTRRDLVKAAADLAVIDHAAMVKRITEGGGTKYLPIAVYVAYHADVLAAIAADQFDAAGVARIEKRLSALSDAIPDRTRKT